MWGIFLQGTPNINLLICCCCCCWLIYLYILVITLSLLEAGIAFAQPSEPVCQMVIRFLPNVGSMYWNAAKFRQLRFVLCMDTLKEQVKVQNYIQPPQINPYGILQFHPSLVTLSSGGYFHGLDDLSYGVDLHRIRWCGILQVIKHVTCFHSACWQIVELEGHHNKLFLFQMRILQHCWSCWWTMPAVTCTVQVAKIIVPGMASLSEGI